MIKFRDYQEAAIESIFTYFNHHQGCPIIAMPTGTGKAFTIAGFIQRVFFTYPNQRLMLLSHVKEIITQDFNSLIKIWPTAPAGVYSSGLKRKEALYPITFGGVATVAKATPDLFGRIDLLLIDECHLLSPNDATMYQRIIQGLKAVNPFLKVVGFTATPYRLGHGMLTDKGGLFTDICFDLTTIECFNWLLDQGYLSRLVPKRTLTELDISGVHMHGGEYKQNELQEAVDRDEVTYAAIQEMLANGQDRQHWLVFASGIEHTIHVTAMFDSLGIEATCVHSKMSDDLRDANIAGFIRGKYRVMVNNGILTTGFDFPGIDLIGMLRPTQSPSLWVQMLGRGTRPVYADGFDLSTPEGRLEAIAAGPKQNCLVMDFAGNTKRLGPINDPVLPRKKGKGGGTAPVKVCEACGTYNHASVRFCAQCGSEFPREVKIVHSASTEELIAESAPKLDVFKVDRVVYTRHQKDGSPDSLKASYFCGLRMFREYVCIEHPGYASKRAREWWRERAMCDVPQTTEEALQLLDYLKQPTHIRVWLKPKYSEVMGCCYNGEFANEQ